MKKHGDNKFAQMVARHNKRRRNTIIADRIAGVLWILAFGACGALLVGAAVALFP